MTQMKEAEKANQEKEEQAAILEKMVRSHTPGETEHEQPRMRNNQIKYKVLRLYPSGHVFGPLLSPFCTKFTCYSKSLCKKNNKNIL